MNLRTLSRRIAYSRAFEKGRGLWEANRLNWNLPLSKVEKLLVGGHLILADFSEHRFPPTFKSQRAAYDGEINYRKTIAIDRSAISEGELRKPYWFGWPMRHYLGAMCTLSKDFERLGVHPPQRVLELGSGAGWMAEGFARMGFDVVGTSIAPEEIADANRRVEGIRASGLPAKLEFRIAPMESVHESVRDLPPFDAVWVYEALHHAYDWRAAFESAFACLRPGGWFVIAAEPNLVHTYVSYRVARLSNTHEVGLSRSEMCKHLRGVGFSKVVILRNHLHAFARPHWIAAQK